MKRLLITFALLLVAVQAWATFVGFGVGVGVGGGRWVDLKPILGISPASHAFGNVSTSSKRTADFTLTNSGNATLTDLSFGTFSSAAFRNATSATSPCGSTLAAKASCNKRVEFGPTAASSYTGTLVILSNQLDNLYASVTGTGIAAGDSTPDAFTFTDQTDVALSSTITSAAITVAGIGTTANISVSGGTYDKNASGSFTSDAGTVSNGDTVRARHTSSGSNSTAVNTTVTIGGVSDTFTSTTVAAGWTDIGFNFRNSSGYVTDGTYETYVLPGTTYPTTAKSATFGFVSANASGADTNSAYDRRIAGSGRTLNGTQKTFQIDLPSAGTYKIWLALGDPAASRVYQYLQVLDTSTAVLTLDYTSGSNGTSTGQWYDASGTLRTSTTAWVNNNASATVTFSTTTAYVKLGMASGGSGYTAISHFRMQKQ
jgi:hypothetical protein